MEVGYIEIVYNSRFTAQTFDQMMSKRSEWTRKNENYYQKYVNRFIIRSIFKKNTQEIVINCTVNADSHEPQLIYEQPGYNVEEVFEFLCKPSTPLSRVRFLGQIQPDWYYYLQLCGFLRDVSLINSPEIVRALSHPSKIAYFENRKNGVSYYEILDAPNCEAKDYLKRLRNVGFVFELQGMKKIC